MTTSGITSFNLTRNQIIRLALLNCNGVEPDETVDPQQLTDAGLYLNIFVKKVSAKLPLFGVVNHEIPLYDEKQSYTIGTSGNKNIHRPVAITGARRKDSSGNETPVMNISRSEYMDLPLKSSTGYANSFCYDKQLDPGIIYVWPVASTASTTLSDGATNQWADSPTTTGEYYYTGTDITAEPTYVFANGTELIEGTIGSLANGEYVWGDQDALGTDTLYIKTSIGDPDAQSSGYIKVLESTPDVLVVTCHRSLEDFTTAANTPDFPQEALGMIVDQLAADLAIQYSPERYGALQGKAALSYRDYMSADNESSGFSIQPNRGW